MYFWIAVFFDDEADPEAAEFLVEGMFRYPEPSLAEKEYQMFQKTKLFWLYCRWKYRVPARAILVRTVVAHITH